MKTINLKKAITLKDAFKLFLFLLIIFSAKAFSFAKMSHVVSSDNPESKIGAVAKVAEMPSKPTASHSATSLGRVQCDNTTVTDKFGSRVSQ